MKWDRCLYVPAADRSKPWGPLSVVVQHLHDQIAKVLDGRVDGYNLSDGLAGSGLAWSSQSAGGAGGASGSGSGFSKKLTNPLGSDTTDAYIRKKGSTFEADADKAGLELVVDAGDSTYGRVCVVDKDNLSNQIGSLVPQDPDAVANPTFSVLANLGKFIGGTSAAFDWELHRNGSASLSDNGSRIKAARADLYVGGDDLSLKRSAAGKALLYDPSGGVTTPMLIGNAANASNAALRFSSTSVESLLGDASGYADTVGRNADVTGSGGIRLLDNSATVRFGATSDTGLARAAAAVTRSTDGSTGNGDHAAGSMLVASTGGLKFSSTTDPTATKDAGILRHAAGVVKTTDGSTGFGDHAVSDVLGYGAATGFRTKMDFGTPTADRSVTIPNRDVTMVGRAAAGTENKLLRFDANGDAKDSAVEDDDTKVYLKRASEIWSGNATGLLVLNATGSDRTDTTSAAFLARGNSGDTVSEFRTSSLPALFAAGDDNNAYATTFRGSDAVSGNNNGGNAHLRPGNKAGSGALGTLYIEDGAGNDKITIGTDGAVTQAGSHTFSGDCNVGDFRPGYSAQTATNGGNYSVAATVHTVFVNASGLGTTNNYDVTVPSAVTYAGRRIEVKITTAGTGSATVTVKSSAGTVEGAAAGTGVPMDATARSRVVYQSDGSNWWDMT